MPDFSTDTGYTNAFAGTDRTRLKAGQVRIRPQIIVANATELETLRVAAAAAQTAGTPILAVNEPVRRLDDVDAEFRWNGTSAFVRITLGFDTEALQDAVAAMFDGAHSNATITYNDTTGKLTIAATGGGGGGGSGLPVGQGAIGTTFIVG